MGISPKIIMDIGSVRLDEHTSVTLGTVLGQGSFGLVRKGELCPGGTLVAVKLESLSKHRKYLQQEAQILHDLRDVPGIPKTYGFTCTESYNALVMELLGESLNEKFKRCGRTFSHYTILRLFEALIFVLEGVHERKYVHRDIKPHNFMTSLTSEEIYLIDFGLSRKMLDIQLSSRRQRKGIVGTLPFVSLNMHFGLPAGRRDDLEALGFMLIYLAKGYLPWYDPRKKKLLETEIRELKQDQRFADLCEGLPPVVLEYLRFVRSMQIDEIPNYTALRTQFAAEVEMLSGVSGLKYDWAREESMEIHKRLTVDCNLSRLHSNQFTPGVSGSHSGNENLRPPLKTEERRKSCIAVVKSCRRSSALCAPSESLLRKSTDPYHLVQPKHSKKHKAKLEIPCDAGLAEELLQLECFVSPIVHASRNKLAGMRVPERRQRSCQVF